MKTGVEVLNFAGAGVNFKFIFVDQLIDFFKFKIVTFPDSLVFIFLFRAFLIDLLNLYSKRLYKSNVDEFAKKRL